MEFTGERFLPEISGDIALEHKHRYLLAALYARDKDVLDIASGEGYGSALLADVARSVVGVDISPEAVAHAERRYPSRTLRFLQGSADAIPLSDASVDLVVSFETIEHHDRHEEMLREIKRVLRPGGLLCISSPNRLEYSEVPGYHNEYHVKELSQEEFEALLSRHFARHALVGQRLVYGSCIARPENADEFLSWREELPLNTPASGLPRPVYCLALASDGALPPSYSSLLEGSFEHSSLCSAFRQETETLRQTTKELQQQVDFLERHVTEEFSERSRQETQSRDQSDRLLSLESELHSMLASRSWRITKPLRLAAGWLRSWRRDATPAGHSALDACAPAMAVTPENSGIRARVAAYKNGVVLSGPETVRDVRLYVAAKGNPFFQELAALIQCGFHDIGLRAEVVVAASSQDCAAEADLHLIVAPHEFFHFIPKPRDWTRTRGKIWMLNTEQAHAEGFAGAQNAFGPADLILDMDISMVSRLAGRGYNADHLPLGYSPSCRLFDGEAPVESAIATEGLSGRIREWTDHGDLLATPLHERPLDCCFFGAETQRRTDFFVRHAALFSDLESCLRLKPLTGPTTPLSTECVSSIVRRSKISLNIHQSEHTYFEWRRIILQGLWQGAAVLSEPCAPAWPFRPNIDYLEADISHMADTLEYLLRSDEGRALAERVRARGRTTLVECCRMGTRLEELLRLHACARSASRSVNP